MTARFWQVTGPFGGQQPVSATLGGGQVPTSMGWRMLDGALPAPLVGSALGHTVVVVLVCLEDWGLLVPALEDKRLPCAFAVQSGYVDSFGPTTQKGYFIGVDVGAMGGGYSANPPTLGTRVVVNHGVGGAQFEVESILGGAGSTFTPRRGDAFVVTYNWDSVAQLVKLKQSFDSMLESAAQATFVPTDSSIAYPGSNVEFSLGHANRDDAPFFIEPRAASPFFGIAAAYYSVAKTAWTAQELSDFEEQIEAAMSTDSPLPIPEGTSESDWTIFDSRATVGEEWESVDMGYTLRGNLFGSLFGIRIDGNNQSEQLRNIRFPKSGL